MFGLSFWFCVGSFKDFRKFVKSKGARIEDDGEDGDYVEVTTVESTTIFLRANDKECLVHELIHHLTRLATSRGLPLSMDTTEAYAYYMEFIFTACNNFLNEKKKTTKHKQTKSKS